MDYQEERAVAEQAARKAATLIRERAGQVRTEGVRAKGYNDLVTAADEEAQRRITRHLQEAFPEHDVLAEEGAADAHRAPSTAPRWIVDPIDGTTNFMHGAPPYAISIALEAEASVQVGVVLEVASGELFSAVRGEGVQVDGTPAQVSRTGQLDDSLITTGFPYRAFDHIDQYMSVLRHFMQHTRGVRRPGSAAVDLAYVACGRYDAFFETGLQPWDVAAGVLLVQEGGGRVTDYHDEEPPRPLYEQQICASNGRLHEAVLEVLQPMQDVRS